MEKKIIKNIQSLSQVDQQKILQFIQTRNIKFSSCADGARINLDTLTEEQLEALDKLVNSMVVIQQMLQVSI